MKKQLICEFATRLPGRKPDGTPLTIPYGGDTADLCGKPAKMRNRGRYARRPLCDEHEATSVRLYTPAELAVTRGVSQHRIRAQARKLAVGSRSGRQWLFTAEEVAMLTPKASGRPRAAVRCQYVSAGLGLPCARPDQHAGYHRMTKEKA